jgi:hypothetical protein
MTQLTVPQTSLSYEELNALLRLELKKSDSGYLCTVRGLARLLGLSVSTIVDSRKQQNGIPRGVLRRLFECSPSILPESLQPISGFDYRSSALLGKANTHTYLLPEVVVSGVIKFYAYDARKPIQRAKQLDYMLSAIGIRALFDRVMSSESSSFAVAALEVTSPATEDTPCDKLLYLIQKLESLRFRREEIVSIFRTNGVVQQESGGNSSYRGVVPHKKKWRAQINVNGATRVIGGYDTEEEAARAYDAYAKVLYGSAAKLNFC